LVKKASGIAEPARADASLGLKVWAPAAVAPALFYYSSDAKSSFRVMPLNA